MKTLGKMAYETYKGHVGGISLKNGEVIPPFEDLSPRAQEAWDLVAQAVVENKGITEVAATSATWGYKTPFKETTVMASRGRRPTVKPQQAQEDMSTEVIWPGRR